MQERLEFIVVWVLVRFLGLLPRRIARSVGAGIGWLAYEVVPRLRNVGIKNLQLAFPTWSDQKRREILRNLYRSLGWLLAEFCQMPKYTRENSQSFLRCEGLER